MAISNSISKYDWQYLVTVFFLISVFMPVSVTKSQMEFYPLRFHWIISTLNFMSANLNCSDRKAF